MSSECVPQDDNEGTTVTEHMAVKERSEVESTKVVFEVGIREAKPVLRVLASNHTSFSVLGTCQHPSINGCAILLGASCPQSRGRDVGTCEDELSMAEQLLADPYLAVLVQRTHIVAGGPSSSAAAAAAAIVARYAYWHCTRPAPGTPASCAALGGCHRRCWWRARRPPTVRLAFAAVEPAVAAEVERRIVAAGLPLAPPFALFDAELVASVVALPSGEGFLTGLAPPVRVAERGPVP